MKRALFSVYKKDGVEKFASYLVQRGYEIVSSGGTYRYLQDKGVAVTEISEITGFPEVLDGRVKTLHPTIHAGILAIRGKADHMAELQKQKIEPIDFVVVSLYPFEETVKNPKSSFEEIIEQIDIGGVALIRGAGKNYQDVAIVVDMGDCDKIMEEMDKSGALSIETKTYLAAKAFSHTAYYDGYISSYFQQIVNMPFPDEYAIPLKKKQDLRYGENPHQNAKVYTTYGDSGVNSLNAEILWGKEMSYNNFMDADAVIDILREFDEPFAVIIKHTNPCGAALGKTIEEAFMKAKDVDTASAFGGIIGLNRKLDNNTAKRIAESFFEIVVAPDYDADALEIIKARKNLRIIKLAAGSLQKSGRYYRRIEGGILAQDWDSLGADTSKWQTVTETAPSESQKRDIEFAWIICKYVKSNAIVYAKDGQIMGIGAGQMSRVDSVRFAVEKSENAHFDLNGAVMASDAFFPFRDSVDTVAQYGIKAIIQPGGSLNDKDSIAACNEHGIAMVFTQTRHFKH